MNLRALLGRLVTATLAAALPIGSAHAAQYKNFDVSIYIPVQVVKTFSDPAVLAREWTQISQQLKVDKVYIETTRGRVNADAPLIENVKAFFVSKGVKIAGGMTFEAGGGGQFQSYCYTDPKDREFVKNIVEFTAHHFDEVILDDFFFVTTKFPSDIAAKGDKSWTEFRLQEMDEVAQNLLVGPAKAINPKIKFVIKFPNWYEHFQGLGFDLQREPKIFDGIYTGTETRDPATSEQHLQQYESYQIIRYFEAIAPGRNGGGWVDTYDIRYVDRYAEQLWDTMFAKAREITLFQWSDLTRAAKAGDRAAWEKSPTSLDYNQLETDIKATGVDTLSWAGVAGKSLEQVDQFLGKLGNPIGLKSYKPYQSKGDDFLHNFLGNIGIPIDLRPEFPTDASIVLLTESAKYDPEIVNKMKRQLEAGKDVVITSSLLRALQDKGIQDIVEATVADQKAIISGYSFARNLGASTKLSEGQHPILIPQVHFLTNDAWPLVRGETKGNGFPLLLSDRYGKGVLYILTIPDDQNDLYEIPRAVLTAIKKILLRDETIHVDSPAQVAVFTYDNDTVVLESYLPAETEVKVSLPDGYTKLRNLVTNEIMPLTKDSAPTWRRGPMTPARDSVSVHLLAHSYAAFAAEK